MKHAPLFSVVLLVMAVSSLQAQPLKGTKELDIKEDLARVMVSGIDKYLSRAFDLSAVERKKSWQPDFASQEAYVKSLNPKRELLKKIIGAVDARLPITGLEFVAHTGQSSLVADTERHYQVQAVRWPVLPGVYGEGLLLEPKSKPLACVVALPDADQTPEMLVGLSEGVPRPSQYARWLAENGCRVVVPVLIDRQDTWSGNPRIGRLTNQPHREYVYRMSYQMGRHIIGYEVQKVLAVIDWFTQEKGHPPVGVYGYGEGGLIALYSGAIDTRIQGVGVSGYFGPSDTFRAQLGPLALGGSRELWEEPIYRNVWSLLTEFGDRELAALVAPRWLMIESSTRPRVEGPPAPRPGRAGAAPGKIAPEDNKAAVSLIEEAGKFWNKLGLTKPRRISFNAAPIQSFGFAAPGLLEDLQERTVRYVQTLDATEPVDVRKGFHAAARQKRQFEELVNYTQKLLPEASERRQKFFWSKLDTSSPAKYEKSKQPLRDYFWEEIIGKLPEPTMPLNARTRLIYDEPGFKGYEVVLDVYEDVIAFGILLVPNGIKPGEKRPVVVCQHGLEGRPSDVVNPKITTKYYHSFGAQLARRGFIVFAPQNPYIFQNDFRQLVRKANPLKLSLYSFIVRQHQRILDWLITLPYVDPARIAYYGLSYGGKVAMRIPPLLERYCLVICSGDFNEWIWKNITLDWMGSYMFTREYEMYEFDLGNTFNYAEMAALIAPRPFMVERGHNDGVGLDEYVAFEYAKVRRLYARLGIADRTEIEFFFGGHEIRGVGTFAFLQRHLQWPVK